MSDAVTWVDIATLVVLSAQLLVIVATASVAYRHVGEARRLREEQIRPVVVLDFDTDGSFFFLTLNNFGNTLARNVRITVAPELRSALDDQTERVGALQMFSPQGVPTLAPGKEIRTLFDGVHQRKPDSHLPDVYSARVVYTDPGCDRVFQEEMTLDLGVYWGLVRLGHADLDDVHARLKELVATLRSWGADGQGLLRLSPGEAQERIAERRRARDERQARSSEVVERD